MDSFKLKPVSCHFPDHSPHYLKRSLKCKYDAIHLWRITFQRLSGDSGVLNATAWHLWGPSPQHSPFLHLLTCILIEHCAACILPSPPHWARAPTWPFGNPLGPPFCFSGYNTATDWNWPVQAASAASTAPPTPRPSRCHQQHQRRHQHLWILLLSNSTFTDLSCDAFTTWSTRLSQGTYPKVLTSELGNKSSRAFRTRTLAVWLSTLARSQRDVLRNTSLTLAALQTRYKPCIITLTIV